MLEFWSRVSKAYRRNGLSDFFHLLIYNLKLVINGEFASRSRPFDRAFDIAHGVNTAGSEEPGDGMPDFASAAQAVRYEPVHPENLQSLIEALDVDSLKRFVFVDLGSGKGRALFVAAQYPFKLVIGIELSATLHQIAVRNIETYRTQSKRRSQIVATCADAASWNFPVQPLVVFMFNPFSAAILQPVVNRLASSLRDHPRECFVIYLNAVHRAVLDAHDSWAVVAQGVLEPSLTYCVWRWRLTAAASHS